MVQTQTEWVMKPQPKYTTLGKGYKIFKILFDIWMLLLEYDIQLLYVTQNKYFFAYVGFWLCLQSHFSLASYGWTHHCNRILSQDRFSGWQDSFFSKKFSICSHHVYDIGALLILWISHHNCWMMKSKPLFLKSVTTRPPNLNVPKWWFAEKNVIL